MSEKQVASVYEWVEIFVSALVCVAILFAFVFRVCGVKGTSMNDTLQDKDFLILSHSFYVPQRGDIVVLYEQDVEKKEPLIKRIIGVEGDVIRIDFDTDTVYINDEPLDEPYVNYPTLPYNYRGPVTVPKGEVYVMGDHRNNSHDSRLVGTIPVDHIIGKAVWRVFPNFGSVK